MEINAKAVIPKSKSICYGAGKKIVEVIEGFKNNFDY
jgi:hypothetical protein